ncbi:MAG: M61 family metallopeptidase [Caulobacteraceae bacterium]|nr:M61 family metallopeptidase [Caulobacter sp.]
MTVAVDVTDTAHRIFNVRETIPVAGPGPLTLLYPQWLPGNHSPSGPIDKVAGLFVSAGGKRLEWVRDPVEVYAYHVDVPAGVSSVDVQFQYLSPTAGAQGRITASPDMVNLQWNTVVLYPAGYYSRDIPVDASVKTPEGWTVFGAVEPTGAAAGGVTTFKRTTLNTLVDSPLLAGRYAKRLDLDPGAAVPVHLDLVADAPRFLEVTPEQLQVHRNLVQQAYKLYGSHHYAHYDFLLMLSDQIGGNGLEHHQSSEDGDGKEYFSDWDKMTGGRDLLAHEYTHSWNGKFRRGADLWTPNFNVPMRDSLLWVYEGQTQYWGTVLAARSGLWTAQDYLDELAATAANLDVRRGRAWRDLIDTTNEPIISQRRPEPWRSWQRPEDYYTEGLLVWLDADTLIRERTGGRKSLDDFARAFFGVDNGSFVTKTYTFDDVVRTLNGVTPYDWASWLNTRLYGHAAGAPLGGIDRGGYRLVYTDTPSKLWKQSETRRKAIDLTYSLGLSVANKDATIADVLWDSPAFKAGLTSGQSIVAINGRAYDGDDLKEAVTAAKATGGVDLLVKQGDRYQTVHVAYAGGLRYPHLEKTGKGEGALDRIIAAKK